MCRIKRGVKRRIILGICLIETSTQGKNAQVNAFFAIILDYVCNRLIIVCFFDVRFEQLYFAWQLWFLSDGILIRIFFE